MNSIQSSFFYLIFSRSLGSPWLIPDGDTRNGAIQSILNENVVLIETPIGPGRRDLSTIKDAWGQKVKWW